MLRPAALLAAFTTATLATAVHAGDAFVLHTWKKVKLTDQFYAEGASFGDFDKDGKTDVVIGPHWYAGPDFTAKPHEYRPVKAYDPKGYSDCFFTFTHDLNGDGWTDILVYGFPGKDASWYANPQGKDGPWTRNKVFDVVDNESPTWGDLTGDGKPEIIHTTGGRMGWVEPDWKDPTKPWTFHPVSEKGGWQKFSHGLGWGDLNGDGKADFLMPEGWWEQPASLTGDPLWTKHPGKFHSGAQIHVVDIDGDGDADVVASKEAHGYGLCWFEQTAKGVFTERLIMGSKPEENAYGLKFSQLHAIDVIDIDGDGVKDIVTGKRYWAHGPGGDAEPAAPAVLYWFRTVRGPKGVEFVPYQIDNDSGVGTQVVAGDVTGDKLPDIVVGNKKGGFVFIHEAKPVDEATWKAAQPKLR